MKTKAIIILMLISLGINSQESIPHIESCFDSPPAYCYDASFLGGQCKPERISRYTNDPDAVFRVLIVYVQLQNDPNPSYTHWPRGSEPEYFGELLAESKQTTSEWWNTYDETTARMSDYWMEVSRGEFHVIGMEVHKILPHDNNWYVLNGGSARAMEDLYEILAADLSINWPLYDKWEKSGSNFIYGDGDGYIDMIYFIFRSGTGIIGTPNARMSDCIHGQNHIIYNQGGVTKTIRTAYDEFGSGFQISNGPSPLEKWAAVSFIPAEHGHYTLGIRDGNWFGGHQVYGKVNNHFGFEEFFSPYELIRHGWFQTKKVDYSVSSTYQLDDWTTRNNTSPYLDPDEILEVPIGD
ncbi:MAG: hypothetical protein L0Y79_06465, partial [Chlorobi bacterium]|nr:hypothetical protein [Chlorobiota bacterium]